MRECRSVATAAAFALMVVIAPARAQEVEAGRRVFRAQCSSCHEVAAGRNRVGPSLFGVVGRRVGQVQGFRYSDAAKAASVTWDEATLDRYLATPRTVLPGSSMAYTGLRNEEQRRNLIAYLRTLR